MLQCRQNPRLQYHSHPCHDLPTFHLCRRRRNCLRMELWTPPRADVAHHRRSRYRHCGLCSCGRHTEHSSSLRRVLHLRDGCLQRELGHHRLGVLNIITDQGEEGRCSRHDERRWSGWSRPNWYPERIPTDSSSRSATSMAPTFGQRVMSRAMPLDLVPRQGLRSSRFCAPGGSVSCLLEKTGGFAHLLRSTSICMGTRKSGYVTLNLALDLKRVSAQFCETRNNVNNKPGLFTINSKVRSSWPMTMSNIS